MILSTDVSFLYSQSVEENIVYSNKETEKDHDKFMDKSTGLEMEQAAEPQSLLEWFTEKYKEFGANLEVSLSMRRYLCSGD